MPITELFDRRAELTIGTIKITDLRFAFAVDASTKPTPNKAKIRVWNLNPDHRSQIEQAGAVPVRLDVGYKDGTQTIFLGDLRTCPTEREGADLITNVESGDGEQAIKRSRVAVSCAKGTSADQVLREVAKALGVVDNPGTGNAAAVLRSQKRQALIALSKGATDPRIAVVLATPIKPGNLEDAIAKLKALGPGVFPAGTVLVGSAAREMSSICKSLGLEWSVQKGALQIVERGKALSGEAVLLSKYTGMIGAPTVDNKGILSVSSLMNPDIFPGRLLVLEGDRLSGQFRIEDCSYVGDTRGNDWKVDMKASRY